MPGRGIARVGDKTSHGGTIVSGASTVLIAGKPAARIGDSHSCPIPRHGTTVIIPSGPVSTLLIAGQPVARMGDQTGCGATIVEAAPTTTTTK
jgi:uncharacterized Zn-binding protein involved in type VI secretion